MVPDGSDETAKKTGIVHDEFDVYVATIEDTNQINARRQ